MIGTNELAIILILVIVLFGAKKVPELARSMGKAKLENKKGMDEAEAEEEEEEEEEPAPKPKKKKTTTKKKTASKKTKKKTSK
ncbi:MAG: twin-arginine translocase TatA/TatE family subunit [Candidatus Hydrothermarchaeales archaeon]